MSNRWVEPDIRDSVVDFVIDKVELCALPESFFIPRIGISPGRFVDWKKRYGMENRHNGSIPRDHWIDEWERNAIIEFYRTHEADGYRRCTYMMNDQDIAYVSPATTYRVLSLAGVLRKWSRVKSRKGTGFDQPIRPHEHWHIDIANIRIKGIHYFLICILDGYSRYIVHWDLRESMKDSDVGIVQQAALEKFPGVHPRFISDNGRQFTGREFQRFISDHDLTHVTTSVNYPQSNGKLERFHKSIKSECIRKTYPSSLEEAKDTIESYIDYYNTERLHSAINYVTPEDRLNGKESEILLERDRKLEQRREERKMKRVYENSIILSEGNVA